MMLVSQNLVGLAAHDEVDDIVRTEVLLDGEYGFQCGDELLACFHAGAGVQTVVAILAVVLGVLFAEVVE